MIKNMGFGSNFFFRVYHRCNKNKRNKNDN